MVDEIKIEEINGNEDQPITKREFDNAMQTMANAFDKIATKDDLKALQQRMEGLERSQNAILDVTRSIDEKLQPLTQLDLLPERVAELEDDVLKLKARGIVGW